MNTNYVDSRTQEEKDNEPSYTVTYSETPDRSVEEIVEEKKEKFIKKWTQYMVEKTGKCPLEFWDDCDDLLQSERQRGDEMVEEALVEYKQFLLNVLDGVDITDGQCNTKAVRLALQSRTITHPNN